MSLNRPIGPAHREADVAATLAQPEEKFLRMLGQKPGTGLERLRLAAALRFYRDHGADGIAPARPSSKQDGDDISGRIHLVAQYSQPGSIAALENHLEPPVVIEVGKSEGARILREIQSDDTGDVGKSAIPIVRVKDVSLIARPSAVGADQLIDSVPPPFVSG